MKMAKTHQCKYTKQALQTVSDCISKINTSQNNFSKIAQAQVKSANEQLNKNK